MSSKTSRTLIDEHPLMVQPTLVCLLGFEKAIILQQIQFLLTIKNSGINREGRHWIWNTAEAWHHDHFPFWKPDTIRKHLKALENDGLLISRQFDKAEYDHKKYYTIDYDSLDKLASTYVATDDTPGDSENFPNRSVTRMPDQGVIPMPVLLSETSSETTFISNQDDAGKSSDETQVEPESPSSIRRESESETKVPPPLADETKKKRTGRAPADPDRAAFHRAMRDAYCCAVEGRNCMTNMSGAAEVFAELDKITPPPTPGEVSEAVAEVFKTWSPKYPWHFNKLPSALRTLRNRKAGSGAGGVDLEALRQKGDGVHGPYPKGFNPRKTVWCEGANGTGWYKEVW